MIEGILSQYIEDLVNTKVEEKFNEYVKQFNKKKPPKKWGRINDLIELYGVKKSTVYKDVEKMRVHPVYSKFVRQSCRTLEVNIEGYDKWRQYRSDTYLR